MAGKKEKSNKGIAISRFVIVALLLVFVLALAIWVIISLFINNEEKTRYAFLNSGSINETLTSDLLIIRNEDLILAESEGIFLPLAFEGERLSKGEVYALILPESAADLVDSYQNAQRESLERSLLLSRNVVQANSRLTRSENDIQKAVSDLRASVLAGDTESLAPARKGLSTALEERSILLKPETIKDTELNKLLNQEADLLNQLLATAPPEGVLRTDKACWISYTTFGTELNIDEEMLADLSLAQARELLNNIDLYETRNKRETYVSRGEPVARCINSMEYKLIALLPEYSLLTQSDAFGISVDKRRLLLDDIQIVQKTVDTDTLLVMQTTAAFGDLLDDQTIRQADVIVQSHSGIKVPLQSIYDYSDTDRIARLLKIQDGISVEVTVFVLAQDGSHAIIEGRTGDSEAPEENELYVLNPWTSKAGSLLE